MQNRYVGDIGDFAKYSLINEMSQGFSLGVAWYLYPDEAHNSDGKHISYLSHPDVWRIKAPLIFDGLNALIVSGNRNVSAVVSKNIIRPSEIHDEILALDHTSYSERKKWRESWFNNVIRSLTNSEIVFADPDNGLCSNDVFKYGNRKAWKRLPLSEAYELCHKRTAIIYHHNSRFKGGHIEEIKYWLSHLPKNSFAVRYRAYSSRTFFVLNPKRLHLERAGNWVRKFGDKAELILAD